MSKQTQLDKHMTIINAKCIELRYVHILAAFVVIISSLYLSTLRIVVDSVEGVWFIHYLKKNIVFHGIFVT